MKHKLTKATNEGRMSSFQKMVLVVCVALSMLDGFDVLAVAFSASHLASDWHLNGSQLGALLSAGLFGMAAGGFIVAPCADRIGRRPLVLLCLLAIVAGMLASACAQTLEQLVALRVMTGLGIGGMMVSVAVIASEYASDKWRSAAISMQSAGYTLGATLGGAVSALLLARYGWRSAFLFGGISTALVIPLAWYGLPESLDFLIARRPQRALDKVNAILRRMKQDTIDELPRIEDSREASAGSDELTTAPSLIGLRTLLIWLAFSLVMAGFYFVMSWTPRLLVQAGMSASQGVTGGVLLNAGGIIGCTLFSLVSGRGKLRTLLTSALVVSGVLLLMFGANALGAAITACVGGLYSLTPLLYPPKTRATGVGWAVGMGRLGAIAAPLLVGMLIDHGWQVHHLYYLFAAPFLLAVIPVAAIFFFMKRQKHWRHSDAVEAV
jgi:benzoate transport